ncbi:MAG TPA: AsmA-like C-terminal region-containing protein [Accumulibacter sp.]|nr:AsmA-like C-terminal region-containing protein [Accumulibacter sp.]HMW18545.1 AsmA-like C-terminal region-containing protein [Accumulibacter sp.]HMY06371.1 AsmA-like C-terminal region-containing protein [Accumulibacter sp.]HNC18536.1 AsmA-like C-terminal region-containing protein [Accumulibacter sp.]HNE13909.1 AsmA-like C-terminal region-containing protein [Accumulibacter sp.]
MTPEELDQHQIYAKTAAGEEAMQQRTLVQRNLRMVLILVDGNATVAELCNKTNQPEMTCKAICELENDGFIEARVENGSVWSPDRYRSRADRPTIDEVSEFSSFGDKYEPASGTVTPAPRKVPPIFGFPGTSTGIFSGNSKALSSPLSSPLSGNHSQYVPMSGPGTVFLTKDQAISIAESPTLESGESSPLQQFGIFTRSNLDKEGPDLKPLQRETPRWYRSWPFVVPLGIVFLGTLLALVAWLFPYSQYLPAMEAAVTQTIGQPVRVGNMHVSLLPKPGLSLGAVDVGMATEREIRIGELRLLPTLSSLWEPHLTFHTIELRDWQVSAQSMEVLMAALATAAKNPGKPVIEQMVLEHTEIAFAGLKIPDLRGQAKLATTGILQSLSLMSADHNLQFDATPETNGLAVKIQALDWLPSKGSAFRFNALNLQGRLAGKRLTLDNVDFRIFDGLARGTAVLTDQQRTNITGDLSFERINLSKLGEALTIGSQFQGDANGKFRFSAPVQDGTVLIDSLGADGSFVVTRGSLGGIDLGEAVRRNTERPMTLGGATRFERMSGAFQVVPAGYRFSQISLTAGLLQGSGHLNVNRSLQVNGQMAVSIGRTMNGNMPIGIGGPLASPQLHSLVPHSPTGTM